MFNQIEQIKKVLYKKLYVEYFVNVIIKYVIT